MNDSWYVYPKLYVHFSYVMNLFWRITQLSSAIFNWECISPQALVSPIYTCFLETISFGFFPDRFTQKWGLLEDSFFWFGDGSLTYMKTPLHDMENNLCHQNHFYRTHQRCHVLMGVPTLSYKALMISCWSTPTALSFHIFFEWVWKKTHGWLYNHYTPLHYIDLYLSYAHDNMCTKHYNPLP